MIKQIVVGGEGGQGVKVLTHVLGDILVHFDYYVTITYEYDANVRGGKIVGYLVYSDKKIKNPTIEHPDIMVKLSDKGGEFKAKYTIYQKGVKRHEGECEEIEFGKIAVEKFGSRLMINMIALGRLLKVIGVDIGKVDLKKKVPKKFIEESIEAVRFGYTFRDELE